MQGHYARMHALGARLTRLLAIGFGLEETFFERCFSESLAALRLLHYSAEVGAV